MPLPTPNTGETEDDFIDRCMGDDTMVDEYPDEDQRYAVCESQWGERKLPQGRQHRYVPQERAGIRMKRKKGGKRTIVGYGAVFYDGTPDTEFELWDGMVERIMPGAFDRALDEDDVRGLFNHDPNQILGRTSAGTMRLSVDKHGLQYEIDIGDTTVAKDVVQHIERRDVTGSSFGFNYLEKGWKKEDGHEVLEVRSVQLFDTGPVTFPAYPATAVATRSDGVWATVRQRQESWKQDLKKWQDKIEALRQRE